MRLYRSAHMSAAARNYALAMSILLFSCAHAPPTIITTEKTLHAAKLSFMATAAGMRAASDQHLLTAAQVIAWNDFEAKFQKGYAGACDVWQAAHDAKDETMEALAVAITSALLVELGDFAAMLAADGGVP
jgi:hypothetical protein